MCNIASKHKSFITKEIKAALWGSFPSCLYPKSLVDFRKLSYKLFEPYARNLLFEIHFKNEISYVHHSTDSQKNFIHFPKFQVSFFKSNLKAPQKKTLTTFAPY